jgi:hypothetical protein
MGTVVLIIGLIITIIFWPVFAISSLGYYSGPSDFSTDYSAGDEFMVLGTVEKAKVKDGYSIMVIKYNNGKYLFNIEKDEFFEGNRVIVKIKIEETVIKPSKIFSMADLLDYDEIIKKEYSSYSDFILKLLLERNKDQANSDFDRHTKNGHYTSPMDKQYDAFLGYLEGFSVKITIKHLPEPGGIAGLIIVSSGIILMIFSVIKYRSEKRNLKKVDQEFFKPSESLPPQPPEHKKEIEQIDLSYKKPGRLPENE